MSLIEQASAIDPTQVRCCPLCRGKGYNDTPQNMSGCTFNLKSKRGPFVPICRLCRGGRVVYLDKICACGSAAVLFERDGAFWWCGRDVCHGYLKSKAIRLKNLERANGQGPTCLP